MNLYNLLKECIDTQYSTTGASINYAIKQQGTTLFLFFENSKGINDWKSNLDFPAKAYKRHEKTIWFAHRGFLKIWKELEPILSKHITDLNFKKIIIVGYSHGAALAMLCHEYTWFHRQDIKDNIFGYGFACPRVYWGIKLPNITKRWKNFLVIRNRGDIVTHLPPFILGYSHVGKMLKVGKLFKYSPTNAHKVDNILRELKIYEQDNRNSSQLNKKFTLNPVSQR